MKRLILDLDDTICRTINRDYRNALPDLEVIERIKAYKKEGFEIVISTSRNVRTYNGSIGLINANTLPVIIEWLESHEVPYDELYIGKPWCGEEGFYVDDKAVRPSEFSRYTYDEIVALLDAEK